MGPVTQNSDLICIPGQRLCLSDENTIAGQGTYERQGYIYSTLAGTVHIRQQDNVRPHSVFLPVEYYLISATFQSKFIEVKCFGSPTIVPIAGDVVTARITQVNQRFAKCSITCIGDHILNRTYR